MAVALIVLLGDVGVLVRRLHAHRSGQILYRDDWQIVAKPEAETPVRWE